MDNLLFSKIRKYESRGLDEIQIAKLAGLTRKEVLEILKSDEYTEFVLNINKESLDEDAENYQARLMRAIIDRIQPEEVAENLGDIMKTMKNNPLTRLKAVQTAIDVTSDPKRKIRMLEENQPKPDVVQNLSINIGVLQRVEEGLKEFIEWKESFKPRDIKKITEGVKPG